MFWEEISKPFWKGDNSGRGRHLDDVTDTTSITKDDFIGEEDEEERCRKAKTLVEDVHKYHDADRAHKQLMKDSWAIEMADYIGLDNLFAMYDSTVIMTFGTVTVAMAASVMSF